LSYEIIYTSSPKGLKDGNRGFCTVAATPGIPRPVLEKLESLSGYRHAYSPSSNRNPINHSLGIVRIQRERYYVLSRIGDAGIDYSGRSNMIAHHLALSTAEVRRLSTGPDSLLADPAFWVASWDRKPQMLPAGRMPSPHTAGDERCGTWRTVFGDSGWAGLLARAVQNDFEPISVIVPSGRSTLALLSEAMGLVAREARWKVCFSTYYTRANTGSDCHWRFVLDGTDEANVLRARRTSNLIDSQQARNNLNDDDPFVLAARTGESSAIHVSGAERDEGNFNRPVTRSQMRRRQAGARARHARLSASKRPVTLHSDYGQPEKKPEVETTPQKKNLFWILLCAGILVACAVTSLIAFLK